MNEEKKDKEITPEHAPDKNKKIHPDTLKRIIVAIIFIIIAGLIFGGGIMIGEIKARFSYRWAENYHRNFAGPKEGFNGDWQRMPPAPSDFIQGYGSFGEIIQINENNLIIKRPGDAEKIIIVNDQTKIIKMKEELSGELKNILKIGDQVVIIGSPNEQGQIEAKLIRVFDDNKPLTQRPIILQ